MLWKHFMVAEAGARNEGWAGPWRALLATVITALLPMGSLAQVQTGDCNASCNAIVGKTPLGVIETGQSVEFTYLLRNLSEQRPIDGAGSVAAELRCEDARPAAALDPGDAGTCCTKLACEGNEDCLTGGGQELPLTFTGTSCTADPELVGDCDVIDDNTVCLRGTLPYDASQPRVVMTVSTTADQPAPGGGSFRTQFSTEGAVLVDVTIDGNCTDNAGMNEFGGCMQSESSLYPAQCEVQMDKQISCDGGTTWIDVTGLGTDDPNMNGTFDDPDGDLTESCTGLPADLIQARYVASNAGEVDVFACEIVDDNSGISNVPIPVGALFVGETLLTIPVEDDADQICSDISAIPPEPAQALLTCQCDPTILPDEFRDAVDTATFTCTDCPDMPASPGWGNPLLAAGLLLGLFWGWRRLAPAQ